MTLAFDAMTFARFVHGAQVRKYTGDPYAIHLAEVAGIVASVTPDQTMIAAAWLHDCIEDQDVRPIYLQDRFGARVAGMVVALSDVGEGNRETRKRLARDRLAGCEPDVQTIKVADLISNTSSIVLHDPKFAVVYVREAWTLLDALIGAERRLRRMLHDQLDFAQEKLNGR